MIQFVMSKLKVLIMSDVHNEFKPYQISQEAIDKVDLIILAGDIHIKDKGYEWIGSQVQDKPVLYVLGNHEYYKKAYPKLINDMKKLDKYPNIHLLENDIFTFNGINFFGATLWTNYKLFGDNRELSTVIYHVENQMNDYKLIRQSPMFRKSRTADMKRIHDQTILSMKSSIDVTQRNVIITHHAPHVNSIYSQFHDDDVAPAYASDLTEVIKKLNPELWIHGHTHKKSDYFIGKTRIISNPKGYPDEENNFVDDFILEI